MKPEVRSTIRVKVLHDVVRELAGGFGAKGFEEVLRRGVLERPLLASLVVLYQNEADEAVGVARISIDWTLHRFLASTQDGREIAVDPTKSLAEQMSETLPVIMDHVQRMCRAKGVRNIEVRYCLVPDVRDDGPREREAERLLGLAPATRFKIARDANPADFDVMMSVVPHRLREVRVDVGHQR